MPENISKLTSLLQEAKRVPKADVFQKLEMSSLKLEGEQYTPELVEGLLIFLKGKAIEKVEITRCKMEDEDLAAVLTCVGD